MKACDICYKTVQQLQSGPKGMEALDCCQPCLADLTKRIMMAWQGSDAGNNSVKGITQPGNSTIDYLVFVYFVLP